MPTPPLPLPRGARGKAFRLVADRLRRDPRLAAVVKAWSLRDGSTESGLPEGLNRLPWVGLAPANAPASRVSVASNGVPLGIRVEIAAAGERAEDALDLWDAVEAALYPGDGSMGAALQAAGALPVLELTAPAVAESRAENHPLQLAAGTISIYILRRAGV